MRVTLGEEIMLLALDDTSGAAHERAAAGWAVAAGTLLELTLAGRLSVAGDRLDVLGTAPTGTHLLDGRLRLVHDWAERRRRPAAGDWLARDRAAAPGATADSLRARGLVVEVGPRALGLFPVRRGPGADGQAEREPRARLAGVVLAGAAPDPRTGVLIWLLHTARLHRLAFPDLDRGQVEPRMAELSEAHWATPALRTTLRTLHPRPGAHPPPWGEPSTLAGV
ncbi:GOLPH3/VPS74 family protein [Streptomyces sp. NPDC002073]|uniref:GOLPH3/VPS74 family protein n=1 Tax=Streptomyces sp. NBC_00239 TaxID=2903640 RepID=UPI002E2E7BF1|nr:GPP34 family phosphoprotein [Streptomyces sp. NBC_00239]